MADLKRYRYGYCHENDDSQYWSKIYADFGECYSDYITAMQTKRAHGFCLKEAYKWRGVFNLEQAARIVMDVDLSADLTVTFGG